jgi:predicted dinucleotide-binding enzyme
MSGIPKRIAIIGGYGNTGSKVAAHLAKEGGFEISILGRDGFKAEALAAKIKNDSVIPRVPVRQLVLLFPIPLHSLFAIHPDLQTLVLEIIHRAINTLLVKQTGVPRKAVATGTITLIQRFGPASSFRT